jgi:class 3 adenylate cyclase
LAVAKVAAAAVAAATTARRLSDKAGAALAVALLRLLGRAVSEL